jgi:hypothetical protein
MTAPDFTDAEFSRLRAIETAPDAPESLRERVADAIAASDGLGRDEWPGVYEERADAAIAVMRGYR